MANKISVNEKAVIYLEDCFNAIKEIPNGSVRLILADPPYGITHNGWDSVIPLNDYAEIDGKQVDMDGFLLWCYKHDSSMTYKDAVFHWDDIKSPGLWRELRRVLVPDGAVILFSAGSYTAELMREPLIQWRYNLVWQKTTPVGFLNANRMPLRTHEDICVFYDKLPVYNPQKTSGHTRKVSTAEHKRNSNPGTNYGDHKITGYDSTERFPTSVLTFATDKQKECLHPTQKPVALCEWLIKSYSNPGDTVLDFCMGSGSTGVAARNTNRCFIGIESDPGIFEKSKARLANILSLEDKR